MRSTAHRADVRFVEADGHALARADEHLFLAVVISTAITESPSSTPIAMMPRGVRIAERGQLGLLDDALAVAHDDELLVFSTVIP